jgi:hypothetical protein
VAEHDLQRPIELLLRFGFAIRQKPEQTIDIRRP